LIAKLTGLVDSLGLDWVVIDVGGVGYLSFCSGPTLGRMTVGSGISLHIETVVREDAILLFGFVQLLERDWFRLLITVQGVGVKAALAILSVLPPESLVMAIVSGDKAALVRAPGIGGKIAARVLSELKDKVGTLVLGPGAASGGAIPVPNDGGSMADAISALINLGYGPSDALRAITQAAGLLDGDATVEALVRAGLSGAAPRGGSR
jgi:Holliday junction DNA helicase RuvA